MQGADSHGHPSPRNHVPPNLQSHSYKGQVSVTQIQIDQTYSSRRATEGAEEVLVLFFLLFFAFAIVAVAAGAGVATGGGVGGVSAAGAEASAAPAGAVVAAPSISRRTTSS